MKTNLPKEWSVYLNLEEIKQEITSAKTARCQRPRTLKVLKAIGANEETTLLDVGCGNGNQLYKEELLSMGVDYNGCDPYNKPVEENIKSINKCMNGGAGIVTLNNVLNTISQSEIRSSILKQCKNAINPESGMLLVLIYEGALSKKEKELGISSKTMEPVKTRDGWQNRWKTEKYVEEILEEFPNVKIVTVEGAKIIVAAINKNLDLDLKKHVKK